MELKIIKFILSNFASHFAILLNAALIWLIRTKSGTPLANYRKILYLGAIYDLIYAFLTAALQPQVIGVAEFYFVAIEGWALYIGHPIANWAQMAQILLTYASMTIGCVQFIYRFFIICL
uniref:Uncharacterized protein n=1 Tax=Panagrolaimus davidi TaxID=227884 RepID=A0A914QZI4_9BILA